MHGYPQVVYFKAGSIKAQEKFKYNRTFDLMKAWVDSHLAPVAKVVKPMSEKKKSQEEYRQQKCISIFENIFEVFEKVDSQQAHLNLNLQHLDDQIGSIQNSEQLLYKRITMSTGAINYF